MRMNKLPIKYKDDIVVITGFGVFPLEELLKMLEELFNLKIVCFRK